MRKITAPLAALLLAAPAATGCSMVERDYPSADPAVLVQRLEDRAQWAYDSMALPPHDPVRSAGVTTGSHCLAGGFSIEKTLPDVVTYSLAWTVENIPSTVAQATERRLRDRFTADGWTLTHDGNRQGATFTEYGFRVEDPGTGDTFDLEWNDSTTSLFLTSYTECAKLPSSAADRPPTDGWSPRTNRLGQRTGG